MSDLVGAITAHWDGRAATFDQEPDHGLADPSTRAAWRRRLAQWLPEPPARVADLGCGTGSLSVLLASMGYEVLASDLSPRMIERARRKAADADVRVELVVSDAMDPALPERSMDVVVVRHLIWTLPDPPAALARWAALLRPGGRLVLVEGRWAVEDQDQTVDSTDIDQGGGEALRRSLPWYDGADPKTLLALLQERFPHVGYDDLGGDADLWGHEVDDERFAVVAYSG